MVGLAVAGEIMVVVVGVHGFDGDGDIGRAGSWSNSSSKGGRTSGDSGHSNSRKLHRI